MCVNRRERTQFLKAVCGKSPLMADRLSEQTPGLIKPGVCYNRLMQSFLRKQIAIPQDHGSWVFILSPLIVGIFAGKTFSYTSLSLAITAMAAFLLRQPVAMAVKAYSGRRPRTDLPAARFWIMVYGVIVLLGLGELFLFGDGYIAYLAVPGIPIFAWHLWLVSRRAERRQAGVEIIATGALSLAAPAAYWIGIGHYDVFGWWLWLLTWLQSAASIVHAYLRLEQRERAEVQERSEQWKMGRRALAYTSFNLVLALTLGLSSILPGLIFVPYLVQWFETLWGVFNPAVKLKPAAIGVRQLIVSILWTILFVATWRF